MKKILITGGKGYIGTYLAKHLREHDFDVYITSRHEEADAKCRRLELLDTAAFAGVCRGMDAVVHLANYDERLVKENGRDALLANAYATRELYRDAKKAGVKKFIYFSTFHIYGKSAGDITEETAPSPQADYGLTHFFAEEYLRQEAEAECPVVVVRLTNGIGAPKYADKWYLAVNDFCRTVYHTGEIVLKSNGLPLRDFVAIRDVIQAVRLLIVSDCSNEKFCVFNVSGEKTYSIREVAEHAATIYEERYKKRAVLKIPAPTEEEKAAVRPLFVSSQKIRRLGWENKISLDDVIRDIFVFLEGGRAK